MPNIIYGEIEGNKQERRRRRRTYTLSNKSEYGNGSGRGTSVTKTDGRSEPTPGNLKMANDAEEDRRDGGETNRASAGKIPSGRA